MQAKMLQFWCGYRYRSNEFAWERKKALRDSLAVFTLASVILALLIVSDMSSALEGDFDTHIRQLSSDDERVRRDALKMLQEAGEGVHPLLIRTLADPQADPGALRGAFKLLFSMGTIRSVPGIRELLKSQDPEVRIRAVQLLTVIGGLEVGEAIADMLKDTDAQVVAEAVTAIGVLQRESDIPRLEGLLGSRSPLLRRRALMALAMLGWESSSEGLAAYVQRAGCWEKVALAEAAIHGGWENAGEHLLGLLNDPAWVVRARAARALGYLKSGLALDSLHRLALEDTWKVAQEAIGAMGRIGAVKSLDVLMQLKRSRRWYDKSNDDPTSDDAFYRLTGRRNASFKHVSLKQAEAWIEAFKRHPGDPQLKIEQLQQCFQTLSCLQLSERIYCVNHCHSTLGSPRCSSHFSCKFLDLRSVTW